MNIGVIGGGSIGLLVSALLSTEHNVTLYVRRDEQKKALNDHGVLLSNSATVYRVEALLSRELNNEDCLIVCVKQGHVPAVISTIQKTNQHTSVIFLQNGMGHISSLNNLNQPIFVGVVEHGALKKDDHIVKHTGKGGIKLAAFNGDEEELEKLVDQLASSLFPINLVENWQLMLYEKLVINAVINPLTAMFEVHNGQLFRNPYVTKLAKELCREAVETLGLDFSEQWRRLQAVATTTKDNISSMWKDLQENRKTEIEAISGYLLNISKHKIPYTAFVYDSIRALEVKKGINE
ncbi:2-dehydropantoate 2-reductase [Virgibacillus ndiopensis]|uniref:2-dehydropantoate 2-reductase n=1 Tax=Virgibacillus ndiopensis TaxID=2004408 RepID=UPI000C0731A1|nr:2-dehydropantoate 2-reductase [Virgibacillus ndiopensis]